MPTGTAEKWELYQQTHGEEARFTDFLKSLDEPGWTIVITHPLTDALATGAIPKPALVDYFIQDYKFLDPFVVLLASMIAVAPTLEDRKPGCLFLAGITGSEDPFFPRAFRELGIPLSEAINAPTTAATAAYLSLVKDVCDSRLYHRILTVLIASHWAYQGWAMRVKGSVVASRTLGCCSEWIYVHSEEQFCHFIEYFRDLLDTAGPRLTPTEMSECEALFKECMRLEKRFFDSSWALGNKDATKAKK